MMTGDGPPIPVGREPPPLHQDQDRRPEPHQADKAKGKPARRKAGDRFAVLNTFADSTLSGLARNEIAVWLLLWRDTKDGTARTSQADLARRAGISDRTVRRTLESLRRRGLLKVTYRGGIGRGASAYRIRPLPPDR